MVLGQGVRFEASSLRASGFLEAPRGLKARSSLNQIFPLNPTLTDSLICEPYQKCPQGLKLPKNP